MWRPWSDSTSEDGNTSNSNTEEQVNVPDSQYYVDNTQEPGTQNRSIEPDSSLIIPETSSDGASSFKTHHNLPYINILQEQNVQAGIYIFLIFNTNMF